MRLTLPGEEDDSQAELEPPDGLHPHHHHRHQVHGSPMVLDLCNIEIIANIFTQHWQHWLNLIVLFSYILLLWRPQHY